MEHQEQSSRDEDTIGTQNLQGMKTERRGMRNEVIDNCNDIEEKQCRICHETEREDPSKNLIRPCLCTGSLLYVHIECLNAWRATSNEASYKCSVCGYKYDVRRSYLSKLILSETFANVVTTLLVSFIDVLLGVIFVYLDRYYIHFKPDIATVIMSDILDFELWWRDSRPFMDVFKFDKDWSWLRLFKNSAVSTFIDVSLVGSTFVSTMGAVIYACDEIKGLIQSGFNVPPHRVGALFTWFSHLLLSRRTLRIPILLGHMFVTRAFYLKLYEYTQRHAKHLGEHILEPYRAIGTATAMDGKAKQD